MSETLYLADARDPVERFAVTLYAGPADGTDRRRFEIHFGLQTIRGLDHCQAVELAAALLELAEDDPARR